MASGRANVGVFFSKPGCASSPLVCVVWGHKQINACMHSDTHMQHHAHMHMLAGATAWPPCAMGRKLLSAARPGVAGNSPPLY